MVKNLLLFFFIACSLALNAQKKVLVDNYDQITQEAKFELDTAMMAPEGLIYEFGQKNNIHGNYTIDITIHEKGAVLSVFTVSNANGSITSQNILKDFLQKYTFNFKLPKGKRYKFQYEFKFE